MIVGKVISSIVSTRKYQELQGYKLLVIKHCFSEKEEYFVAADDLGAGVGEFVLISKGSAAQYALKKEAPIDAVVIGIIDNEPTINE